MVKKKRILKDSDEKSLILELFTEEEQKEFKKQNNGSLRGPCPDCGSSASNAFIIFKNNRAYCHKTQANFNFLEVAALKYKLIRCSEGRIDKVNDPSPLDKEMKDELFDILEAEKGTKFTLPIRKTFAKYAEHIPDEGKTKIELPGPDRLVGDFAKELGEVFKDKNTLFYKVEEKNIVEIRKIQNDDHAEFMGFCEVTPPRFVSLAENYISPYRTVITKYGPMDYEYSMTSNHARLVLESKQFQDQLPMIKRIFTVQQPILHKGKLTFPKPGYDGTLKSWLPHDAPKISDKKMSLKKSKEILKDIYSEFCFKTEQDGVNAVAALLTPFIRGLYSRFNIRTPVFFYEANRERAGKDYAAGITGIMMEGHALEEPPISSNENKRTNSSEELRKKLLAAFIAGRKRLHFANNKGYINNAVFEGAVTSAKYSDRVLGRNEILTFDNELEFSLSGNVGISYTPDFANRARFIRLFLEIEDANSRKFKKQDLHRWIHNNREEILSALYALVRHWYNKKMPKGKTPFSSFPEWAEVCGGILVTAKVGDPCVQDKELLDLGGDKQTQDMKLLFELCYEKHPDTYIKKNDIKSILVEQGHDEEIFGYLDLDNKADQIKFGKIIEKYVGRIFSDIKLLKIDGDRPSRATYIFKKYGKKQQKKGKNGVGNVGNVGNRNNPGHQRKTFERAACTILPTLPTLPKQKKGKNEQKNDVKTQFYDADECKKIVPKFTEKQVFDIIKKEKASGITFTALKQKVGIGATDFKNSLLKSGKIILKKRRYFPK